MFNENLFDEWVELNQVIASYDSRFDILREQLPKCKTKKEAEDLLEREELLYTYPVLPDWLE